MTVRRTALLGMFVFGLAAPARAQVDQQKAAGYFKEAQALCARDAGRLWGRSLCGPMAIADPATQTIATSEPAPAAAKPAALGFVNAPLRWGGTLWSTYAWSMIPADPKRRGGLLIHELFHRVQFELGLMTPDGQNAHIDTLDGRYWLQLEWRALSAALATTGAGRAAAVQDALAFRAARRAGVPDAAANEGREEIREGLAQYTGTVIAHETSADAIADARAQLADAPRSPSFVRNFAYPLGAAYGLLLDDASPGWPRRVKGTDDLGALLMAALNVQPARDAAAAASRYDGAALRQAEEERDRQHQIRVADLRRRFVDGPVLLLPGAGGSFSSAGVTAIPGAGTVYPTVRVTAPWGSLEAAFALRTTDTLVVPAPAATAGTTLTGDGWSLRLAPGWIVRPGPRAGDFEVVRGGG